MTNQRTGKNMMRLGLFTVLFLAGLFPVLWSQQGCTGSFPPLTAMVVTATYTITPIPTPAYPTCTNTSTPTLIDDMEDNNNQVLLNQCRNGYWYSYNDGSGGVQKTGGVVSPFTLGSPGVGYNGTGTSAHCIEVSTNTGFSGYGAGFGFSFMNGNALYNAFGYHGIQFYAKNTVGAPTVPFAIIDQNVNATSYQVGPHTLNMAYTSSWALYQVSMAQMAAAPNSYVNAGYTATVFDPSQLIQVQWSVGPGVASDIWIDNVSFY